MNHAAVFQKIRKSADGQDRFLLQGGEVFRKAAFFRLADEEDLAVVCCGSGRQSAHDEFAPLMGFIRNEGIERFAEAVFAEDANGEGGGVVAGVGRPTDKFLEVIEIGSFDV